MHHTPNTQKANKSIGDASPLSFKSNDGRPPKLLLEIE
jgi:hypothetical protein